MRIKRFFLFFIIFMLMGVVVFSQKKEVKKKYELSVTQQGEVLVLDETDSLCSYSIKDKMDKSILITGGEMEELFKTNFSQNDKVYINKGSQFGIRENQIFMIVGEGDKIDNKVNGKTLGRLYVRKGLARVECVYEDRAVIFIKHNCHPVIKGDFLVPYKPETTSKQKPINIKLCRIPNTQVKGQVVFMNLYLEVDRNSAETDYYVTVDIGSDQLSRGDWLLLYKIYRKDLPPVIMGSGIVIATEKNNSTVRVIDSTLPVTVGTKAILYSKATKTAPTTQTQKNEENPPIIETLKDTEPGQEKAMLDIDAYFDFDEPIFQENSKVEMDKIKDFIEAHQNYEVILRGYCCSIGSVEFNLELSKNRVEAVKKYLVETLGVNSESIEANYYGEKDAPCDNSTEEQRRKNRLVKIQVLEK